MRFNKLRIRLSAISSFFALALGASTFGPASVAAQQQAVLGGVISDAVTGKIVDAAAVTLVGTGIETRTAADGIFEFPDAPLGFVTVHVQAPGYPAVVEEVEMTPGTVRIMQVILHSADAVLRDILGVVPATDAARRGDARSAADLLAREGPRHHRDRGATSEAAPIIPHLASTSRVPPRSGGSASIWISRR